MEGVLYYHINNKYIIQSRLISLPWFSPPDVRSAHQELSWSRLLVSTITNYQSWLVICFIILITAAAVLIGEKHHCLVFVAYWIEVFCFIVLVESSSHKSCEIRLVESISISGNFIMATAPVYIYLWEYNSAVVGQNFSFYPNSYPYWSWFL